MTTSTYAVIDSGDKVTNVVLWDGGTEWVPPSGMTAVEVTDSTGSAYIGGLWNGAHFSAPE